MSEPRIALLGSERTKVEGAKVLGDLSPDQRFVVTVVLKPSSPVTTRTKRVLSQAEFVANHGAPANAISAVRQFAQTYGLSVISESAAKRTVELAGPVAAMSAAFGVTLKRANLDGKVIRYRIGPVMLPADIAPYVLAVLGLDDRPQAEPRSKVVDRTKISPHASTSLTPVDAAKLYNFPTGVNGAGQIVAIVELGGGFAQSDLNAYFAGLGLPVPSITAVSVSASNNPGVDVGSDREVMLDIEVVGGVAPGAKQLVYFSKPPDQDFLNCVLAAVHATPPPTVISISWGKAESGWTNQAMQAFTQAFQDANALGISVFVASGDAGSSDGTGALAVDFPASSPAAIGCGGTSLVASGSTIASEVVWNDGPTNATGGGVSQVFPKPSYQSAVSVPPPPGGTGGGRGVPDVCGHASAWKVRVDGNDEVLSGTSAVAPLWSGLTALLAQKLNQPLGLFNTQLYQNSVVSTSFRDITQGSNDSTGSLGAYSAASGWDPCTGLGSPKGTALLAALSAINPPTPHPTPHPTPPTPTPHPTPPPTPHPTPHPTPTPTPHPTPHPTPTPTPHPTPHPTPTPTPHPTPTPTTGTTSTTGHVAFTMPEAPPYPYPVPPSIEQPSLPSMIVPSGSNAVAIVGVVGLAALMGMVAATGVVAVVAINKDKS